MARSLWIPLLAFCGCYRISSAVVGPSIAPRQESCEIDFSRQRAQELSDEFEQVGAICFGGREDANDDRGNALLGTHPDVSRYLAYRPGSEHEAVRREACSLGGELVTPAGICGRFPYDLELAVWRKKR
jgi:hypothetical protein